MAIKNNGIDLLYQNHSPTQQVVQTERVDNSNFILKFEDIQNTKQNKIDKDKKELVMDTVVSLSGGAFITELICFIMFLKLLQLGYEVPPALPQAAAQFPGVDGLFVAPDIPETKSNHNHRTESVSSGPNSVRVPSESGLNMKKPDTIDQEEYNKIPKATKRQLQDPEGRDRIIKVSTRLKLDLTWNQVEFKTEKHFNEIMKAVGICPDPELSKEERTLMLQDYIYNTLTDPNKKLAWYEDGKYQGGTPKGHDSINILDQDTGIVFSFKKYRGDKYLGNKNGFTTVFVPLDDEIENLRNTGNLLTKSASEKYDVPLQLNSPESNIVDKNNE